MVACCVRKGLIGKAFIIGIRLSFRVLRAYRLHLPFFSLYNYWWVLVWDAIQWVLSKMLKWEYFGRSCNQNFSILKQVNFSLVFFNYLAMLSGCLFYLAVDWLDYGSVVCEGHDSERALLDPVHLL